MGISVMQPLPNPSPVSTYVDTRNGCFEDIRVCYVAVAVVAVAVNLFQKLTSSIHLKTYN